MSNYLISGANSEIGFALAKRLFDNGHNLILVSRSKKMTFFLMDVLGSTVSTLQMNVVFRA